MRIVTKVILTIAICSMIGATALSIYILDTPFSKEIPEDNLLSNTFGYSDETVDQEIENIHFLGTWRTDKAEFDMDIKPSGSVDAMSGSSDKAKKRSDISVNNSISTQTGENKDDEKPDLEDITLLSGNFTIDEEQKIITLNKSSKNYSYRYSFTNKNNTLFLTNIKTNETLIFQRKIPDVDEGKEVKSFVYNKVNISGNFSFSTDKKYGNLSLNESYKIPVCLKDVNLNQSFEGK
ncbi:MAG: hypothetical protein V5A64_05765, partial [Candidatus Thermoplasmatota archaeon]